MKTKLEGAHIGDAVVIQLADLSQQSAILFCFSCEGAHFAWKTGPGRRDVSECFIPSREWASRIIALFPKGAKFLAV